VPVRNPSLCRTGKNLYCDLPLLAAGIIITIWNYPQNFAFFTRFHILSSPLFAPILRRLEF